MLRSAAGLVTVIVGHSANIANGGTKRTSSSSSAEEQTLGSLAALGQSGEPWISEWVIPRLACYITCVGSALHGPTIGLRNSCVTAPGDSVPDTMPDCEFVNDQNFVTAGAAAGSLISIAQRGQA